MSKIGDPDWFRESGGGQYPTPEETFAALGQPADRAAGQVFVAIPIPLTFPDDASRHEDAYEIQTEDRGTTICYAPHSQGDDGYADEIVRRWNAVPVALNALRTALWAFTTRDQDGQFRATPRMLAEIQEAIRICGGA